MLLMSNNTGSVSAIAVKHCCANPQQVHTSQYLLIVIHVATLQAKPATLCCCYNNICSKVVILYTVCPNVEYYINILDYCT